MSVAPPSKGLAGLADDAAVVPGATDTVGGKLEVETEEVTTKTSAGFQVLRSGTRLEGGGWVEVEGGGWVDGDGRVEVVEGGRVVGLEVVGTVVEPVRAEGERGDVVGGVVGDVVGVAVTGAPIVDVVGSLVLVEEEERVREEEEGVVPVEEEEEEEESSIVVLEASSESAVTVINHS